MITLLNEIAIDQTGLLPQLVTDYLHNKDSLSQFYRFPFSFDAFADVIREKEKDNTNRRLLVEVLTGQYSHLSRSEATDGNIQSLLSGKTFTVVAAHQPCLLMGPAFNIYKIAGAINLAQQLKSKFPENNFVPVFWMGSEDHDTEELNHTHFNGKKITWQGATGGAIGRAKSDSLKPVLEELKLLGLHTDISDIFEQALQHKTFGRFTQHLVHELFKNFGLIVLDADDKKLKQSFSEVIKEEILDFTARHVLEPNLFLLRTTYKLQATPRDINFFYLGDGYRERILYNSLTQKFEVKDKGIFFTDKEISAEIDNHPERFSPNVIYRPLYQETVLPNLAFIGGAGELSYWLELEALFNHYQVNYPMLALRSSMAIVNPGFQKKLDKLGLNVKDLFGDIEQLVVKYVKENLQTDIDITHEKEVLGQIFNSVLAKAESADVTLKQNAASEKQKAITAIENIEAKMLKAEKRKQETAVNQIRAAHEVLFPGGELQERREGFISFYKPGFIAEVIKLANPFDRAFKIVVND